MIWLVTRAAFCFSIFATFFTLYEVGYIVNDCVIANREPSPTLRFRSCEYWKTIVGAKIVSFILLTIVIWGLFKLDVYIFLLYNIIVVSFFLFLHNRASIEDRGISYFWLQYMRLMVIPFTVTADAYVLLLLSFAILPEVLRRTLRYLRIKFQDGKRRFTTFDLRVFIMSSFFVTIGFFKLSPGYLQLVVIPYAIIVGGILVSIIIQE